MPHLIFVRATDLPLIDGDQVLPGLDLRALAADLQIDADASEEDALKEILAYLGLANARITRFPASAGESVLSSFKPTSFDSHFRGGRRDKDCEGCLRDEADGPGSENTACAGHETGTF